MSGPPNIHNAVDIGGQLRHHKPPIREFDSGRPPLELPIHCPLVLTHGGAVRVALVHDWLTGMRGGEKCLDVLCRMFPHAELYTLLHTGADLSPPIRRMRIRTSFLQHFPGAARFSRPLLPLMPLAVQRLRLQNCDLVISLSHAVAKAIPVPQDVPHICYCFTPMRYIWHLQQDYLRRRDSGGFSTDLGTRLMRLGISPLVKVLRHWDRTTADRVS